MQTSAIWACALLALSYSGTTATAAERWLHVRVQDRGTDAQNISINLPLSFIEALLPTIQTETWAQGKLHWSGSEVDGVDLREVLRALRETPDANFITIRDHGESLRVAKERGFLLVRADEWHGGRVRIRIPLEVVLALVGQGDELDLQAGLRALAEYDGRDLVTVESADSAIRVWIDDSDSNSER